MCSFIGKLNDHINITKVCIKYKFRLTSNLTNGVLLNNKINVMGIYNRYTIPIDYLKINNDEFNEFPVKFGSKNSKLLVYETDYGYFIKPFERVARN
jgi:hypothetical protein